MEKDINKGVTLIALIITIIVVLILTAVSIATIMGENGISNKTDKASEETNKQTATERMNLKITNAQIESYAKTQQMPTLQFLADNLCEDEEIEYVALTTQKIASLEESKLKSITVGQEKAIFTKLRDYPYEFEIDKDLKLASINGVKVAEKEIDELEDEIKMLKELYQNLKSESTNPVGTLISYMGNNVPNGYLPCNGQTYNIAEYSGLAEQIKREFGSYNYYGGDGTTTFATPNVTGKFLSSSIYGKSTTVTPENMSVLYCIKY